MVTRASAVEPVVMGRVVGLFGVRGWIKVHSDTRPREGILNYNSWLLRVKGEWRPFVVIDGQIHGKGLIAHLQGCDDRDQAAELVGMDIAVDRDQLPVLPEGEYYWWQLEGLKVINLQNDELGTIDHLFETGANDVIVLRGERERLLPYIPQVIKSIDLEAGVVVADWDADF